MLYVIRMFLDLRFSVKRKKMLYVAEFIVYIEKKIEERVKEVRLYIILAMHSKLVSLF